MTSARSNPLPRHTPSAQAKGGREDILILGIESSCDETAASVLSRSPNGALTLHSSVIASQDEIHRPFGGVVPEMAARAHMSKIDLIIDQAVTDAQIEYSDLSAVAATAGPGLIGGVIAGLMSAKGLALALGIPLIGVNHLEGHALSPKLSGECPFPYLLLLVSGGHTQLLSVNALGDYTRLGSTVDDAAGEAFDKTAKVLGLGFPGGPALERRAREGDPKRFSLPRPFINKDHADFSFAGLKTATLRAFEHAVDALPIDDIAANQGARETIKADISASFQQAVCDILDNRTRRAMDMFKAQHPSTPTPHFVVAGGVAANQNIRTTLMNLAKANGFRFLAPPLKFCTDNAAMIALAGAERFAHGLTDDLSIKARPRWPLDEAASLSAPASGSGKKGPKS